MTANTPDGHHRAVRLVLISVLALSLLALLVVALLLVIRQLRLSAVTIEIQTELPTPVTGELTTPSMSSTPTPTDSSPSFQGETKSGSPVTVLSNPVQTPVATPTIQSAPAIPGEPSQSASPTEPPLLLKSIGLNLGIYDPATNRAGDFQFTKQRLNFDRLWMDYGFVIPANQTSTGQAKANPQPTFIVPLGTKVRSLVDGVVVEVKTLYSGDWTVMVAQDTDSSWIYETEHVVNPIVQVGDRVTAGQVVAEAANFNNNAPEGFGVFEIGILHGGNPPSHVCPFAYLDPSIKEDVQQKIVALYRTWEEYRGDPTLYDETSSSVAGCATPDEIDG